MIRSVAPSRVFFVFLHLLLLRISHPISLHVLVEPGDRNTAELDLTTSLLALSFVSINQQPHHRHFHAMLVPYTCPGHGFVIVPSCHLPRRIGKPATCFGLCSPRRRLIHRNHNNPPRLRDQAETSSHKHPLPGFRRIKHSLFTLRLRRPHILLLVSRCYSTDVGCRWTY